MKKPISIILILCLLLSLVGCTQNKDDIFFYYTRDEILFGQSDGVIASEVRDVSGHEGDLIYLLMLYLEGPHNQEFISPFPAGTTLTDAEIQADHLYIVLSEEFDALQGMDHTIACTCIAYTCFANTEYSSVSIRSASQDTGITLTRENIALSDTSATNPK